MKGINFKYLTLAVACLVFSASINAEEKAVKQEKTKEITQASLFAKQGKYKDALKILDQAIQTNPKNGRAYKLRANVYFAMGEYELALKDADQVISMFPTHANPYVDRAIIHYAMRNYYSAQNDIDRALAIKPDSMFAKKVRDQIMTSN